MILRKKYLNLSIKILFLGIFTIFLYHEITQRDQIGAIYQQFLYQLQHSSTTWLGLTLLLMPINWFAETQKWFPLVRKVEAQFSIWQAYKSVLAGITLSLFTPNRIGDYGGRVLYVQPEHQLKTFFATLISHLAQQVALIAFGLLGFCYFVSLFFKIENYLWYSMIVGSITFIIFNITFFLNIRLFIPLARRLKLLHIRKVVQSAKILKEYSTLELFRTLKWATLRYLIYSTQYYLMLHFFGIDAPLLQGMAGIATIYFIQTSLPIPPAFGLLARGEIALKIWGLFPADYPPMSILAATFTLWVINLIIPALLGTLVLLQTNFFKKDIR